MHRYDNKNHYNVIRNIHCYDNNTFMYVYVYVYVHLSVSELFTKSKL